MVSEVIHTPWGARLASSLKGILVGLVLFFASFWLLAWNEGRAVARYQDIHEMRDSAVSTPSSVLDATAEGRLVHTSGLAETNETLRDPEFAVEANALKLRRSVEMFQWAEQKSSRTRKKIGGGTETVTEFTYVTGWEDRVIDSSRFHDTAGHLNPDSIPYEGWSAQASAPTLGAFSLAPPLVRVLNHFEPVPLRDPKLPEGGRIHGDRIYVGGRPDSPAVGDVRISFESVPPGMLSVVARQSNGVLVPWINSRGREDFRVQQGEHSLQSMMDQAKRENQVVTLLLRLAGWFLMTIGLASVFKPLSVLGDVVPLVGSLIGGGIGIAAGLLSAALSLATIAIAWIVVRPLVGVPLLLLAAGLLGFRFLHKPAAHAAVQG